MRHNRVGMLGLAVGLGWGLGMATLRRAARLSGLTVLLLAAAALLGIATGLGGRCLHQKSDAPGIVTLGTAFSRGGRSGALGSRCGVFLALRLGLGGCGSLDYRGGRGGIRLRSRLGLRRLADGGTFASHLGSRSSGGGGIVFGIFAHCSREKKPS
jgi:hypothetical protein